MATLITFRPEDIDEDTILEQAKQLDRLSFQGLLRLLSDYYHNDQPLVSDETYDILIDVYEAKYGPYAVVGAEPRREKVNLPHYLGSLRKVKKMTELTSWSQQYPGPYLIEDKIDGMTLLYVQKTVNGRRQFALYTRGGGYQGVDVSHLIPYLRLPVLPEDMAVRGEVVMHKATFEAVGTGFANARNLVSGLVLSKKHFRPEMASQLSFYAYHIVSQNNTPEQDLVKIMTMGLQVPSPVSTPTVSYEILEKYLAKRREVAPYEMDGLVIYQNKAAVYPPGEDPRHIVAFKMEEGDTAVVTVNYVEWNVSKDKLLKPIVHYQPVKLAGAELRKASGYNARFISDNKIGPGASILITRSGDVIPKILSVITPSPTGPQLPDPAAHGAYAWNQNQVEFVVTGINRDITIKKMEHFVNTLGVKNMGPTRVKKIAESGFDSIQKLITATAKQLATVEGIGNALAEQFYTDIQTNIKNVKLSKIMDASGVFPHIGERRFEMILDVYPNFYDMLKLPVNQLTGKIKLVKGFNQLADEIADHAAEFLTWLQQHPSITIRPAAAPVPVAFVPTPVPVPVAVVPGRIPIPVTSPTPVPVAGLIPIPVTTPNRFPVTTPNRMPIPVAVLPPTVAPPPTSPGTTLFLQQQQHKKPC